MRNDKKIVFGIILLLAGVVIALNAFGITGIDLLFPGWWTLFIIIPCGVGVFTGRDRWGNVIGLLVGVALLIWQLDIIDLSFLWKLVVPAIIIVIAIKLIVTGLGRKGKENKDAFIHINVNSDMPAGTAIFGGKEMKFDDQVFDGCELTAIFGGVECDLSRAIIEKDCVIKATSIFGGIDVMMPDGVNVKVNSTNIFGGTDDECNRNPNSSVTVYVEAVSIFGGVDLR